MPGVRSTARRSTVRILAPADRIARLPELADLLVEAVGDGASLGFLPPLSHEDARAYWLSLEGGLSDGTRLLLGAFEGDRLLGSIQLVAPPWPNARHRAELQKLFVATDRRGHGLGRRLVAALHDAARDRGRSLILLNTRHGDPAEMFYRSLGYRAIGVTPGYTVGPVGERYDNLAMFLELTPPPALPAPST